MLPQPWIPFGFGRFAVDLPPSARLRGRQQALVQLPLTARALAPGEDLAAIHQQLLADKRALPPPPGRPQVVHSARMLRADMLSIIHFDDPETPDSIVMEAVMVAGGTAFTLRAGNSLDRASALEDAAARIGASLLPTLEPNPSVPGFAVDRAVVAMPMHWQESAEAFFHFGSPPGTPAGAPPGTDAGDQSTLALSSHSNADLVPRPLLEKQMLGLPRLAAVGVMAIATRSGPRMLADLPGEEVILTQPSGGALLQWEYVGEPRSSTHPDVSIRMELGDEVSLDATLPLWDMLLASFRRRREA